MASVTTIIEFYNGSSWADISADVVGSFKWGGGITSMGPTDRVATTGTLELSLNNSAQNSGKKLGYYSPDHANCRTGWAIGAKIRVKRVSGTTKYNLYRVKDIEPTAGLYGERLVSVTAVDYMDEFEIRKIEGLAIQTDKRGNELLTSLVSSMPYAPENTSYDTGLYLFPYAFHDEQDENTFAVTVMQKIAQSDMSYIYLRGDATDGETLVYEQPQGRYHNTTSAATFNDTMIDMSLVRARDNIYNSVRVTVNPVEVGTSTTEVIAKVENVIELEPNETKTITLRYIDQSTTRRISAKDIINPVAGTDYISSRRRKSRQGELTADLTVTYTAGSNSIPAELENGVGVKMFVTLLQARGTKVTMYNKIECVSEDATSIAAYGERTITYNMPYQQESNLGKSVADEILRRYKDPVTQVSAITYNANRTSTFMGYAMALEPGSRITITESVSGINTDYFINAVEYNQNAGVLNVTYTLEKTYGAAGATYFKLGTSTFGDSSILIPL